MAASPSTRTSSKARAQRRSSTQNAAKVPTSKLRRIALASQGLTQANPFGRGKGAVQRAVAQLGYVQIDTISVVARAHHHVLHTRVANFEPKMLDRLIGERRIFEYWSHAAAYLPIEEFRFALPRMRTYRDGTTRWMRSRDTKLMKEILARIRSDGPMLARQFEGPDRDSEGWWDWKPAKRALEQLFMQGDLMITARDGFQKKYDLTERVLPNTADTTMPSVAELARHLVDGTVRAHGFSTMKGFTYLRRGADLRKDVKGYLDELVSGAHLVPIALPTGELAYANAEQLEQAAPRTSNLVQLLSPFDNSVIQRERGTAVFDFDYQIECYVTEAKRQYGYFCLPILYRDRFVGRADCKAHRSEGRFEVKALFIDEHMGDDDFLAGLADALWRFAVFNDCQALTITKTQPTKLKTALVAEIKRRSPT